MLHEILNFEFNMGLKHLKVYRFYIMKLCPQSYQVATVTRQEEKTREQKKLWKEITKLFLILNISTE
jgi:hypothetical protein